MTNSQPRMVVYSDSLGATHTETVITASNQILREEELEALGYHVFRD